MMELFSEAGIDREAVRSSRTHIGFELEVEIVEQL